MSYVLVVTPYHRSHIISCLSCHVVVIILPCHQCLSQRADSSSRHVGKASPGGRETFRSSETSSFIDSRRAERESRVRPWLMGQSLGSPKPAPIDISKAAPRLQEDIRTRIQARKDAALARSQAIRQPARSQATTRAAPEKASTSQVRSQAIRHPARSQATTRAAPEKASISQVRSQAIRQPARSQAATTRKAPVKGSRLRLGESRAMECLLIRDRLEANVRGVGAALASRSSKGQTVVRAHRPEHKPADPKGLPVRPANLPSSPSSTPPSGGQLISKTRRGAGVAATSSKVSAPKAKSAHSPVDDSSLPAGVYEKVRREGSDGPAFTLKKVSWKFGGGWENVFSPPTGRVILSPEPEETEANLSHCPLWITPAPRYLEIGKTPVRADCARPRRRPMAPPMPAPPPESESVYWPERSETRLTSAGSVATEATSVKVSGCSDRSRSLHLSHRLGSVVHHQPSHRSAAPARSALRTGSSRMATSRTVRFDDSVVQQRVVSRWIDPLESYPDYRQICGVIVRWTPDADWNPDPEHPSDSAHVRTWTVHPEDFGHHSCHRIGRPGFGTGDELWGNVSSCAPHLRKLEWENPCPFQAYRLPKHPVLGEQGECSCEASGPFDCPRKIYRKRLDLAYVSRTCRGPNNGKLAVLRYVLKGMDWAGGVAVLRS